MAIKQIRAIIALAFLAALIGLASALAFCSSAWNTGTSQSLCDSGRMYPMMAGVAILLSTISLVFVQHSKTKQLLLGRRAPSVLPLRSSVGFLHKVKSPLKQDNSDLPHPFASAKALYYEVVLPGRKRRTEYIDREEMYQWLRKVHRLQLRMGSSMSEPTLILSDIETEAANRRVSPLAQRLWAKRLGRKQYDSRYHALRQASVLDPSYPYGWLRVTPWMAIILLDETFPPIEI